MKRNITEVLRRGFDVTVANWPVVLLRIMAPLVMAGIFIVALIAAVIPLIVSAGLSRDEIVNSTDPVGAVVSWMIGHAMLFGWMLLLFFVVLCIVMVLHSFVIGASTQIYVDAERAATAVKDLRVFTLDRWLAGGRAYCWRIFWIYNLAWSAGLAIVLVPLLLTLAATLMVSQGMGRLVVGCMGLALVFLVFIPIAVVTSIWCTKAITICVARSLLARDALRAGWREFRLDVGRHLLIAIILFVVSMAVNSLLSGFSLPLTFSSHQVPSAAMLFAPVRIVIAVVQSMISGAVGSCLLACFVSMTQER